MKGRRLLTGSSGKNGTRCVGALADKALVPVVARKGSAVLEEWMPGTPLNDGVAGADVLERCGELLGSIHGAAVPRSLVEAYGPGQEEVRQRIDRLNSEIDELTRTSLITPEFASQLVDTARCAAPADASVGFVHGDFSPENIVRDPGDSLYCIDNVKVALDAYDWDLARTRYLWPMDETQTSGVLWGLQPIPRFPEPGTFEVLDDQRPGPLNFVPAWASAHLVCPSQSHQTEGAFTANSRLKLTGRCMGESGERCQLSGDRRCCRVWYVVVTREHDALLQESSIQRVPRGGAQ